MKNSFKVILIILLFVAVGAYIAFYIGEHTVAVMEPKGMIGMKERELIITASLLMLIVVIPVYILTLYFSYKYRESNKDATHEPDYEHNNIAECCWWGVPLVIIVILAVITWKSSHELSPFRPIETNKKPLTIQVVALEWKWLFIYPEEGIATVNYIAFPKDTPINFEITADAPMNSFWIPQLGGQIYAMPAMRSKLHLIANEYGTFRGASANISGTGFAGMYFNAKSVTDEEYEEWVRDVRASEHALTFERYTDLVRPSEYVPPAFYVLPDHELFERIIDKYSPPKE